MDLMTKDPFFGNLFDDLFESKRQNMVMRSDVYEKEGNYIIEVDVPGFKKDDVQVDYDNGYVTITAKKEDEKENDRTNYIRRERFYGELTRSYYVDDVDENKISAKFEDGTLKLTIPKEEVETKTRLIPIE